MLAPRRRPSSSRARGPALAVAFSLAAAVLVACTRPPAPVSPPPVAPVSPPPVAPRAPEAADVVARVQANYAGVDHLAAKFRLLTTDTTFGRTAIADGKLWILKPGKTRWDFQAPRTPGKRAPVGRSDIATGGPHYVIDHALRQITRRAARPDVPALLVAFVSGEGDLAADFVPALDPRAADGRPGDHVLRLTPRQPGAPMSQLSLVVDGANYRVKRSILVDTAGTTHDVSFYEPDVVAVPKASWFKVDPATAPSYQLIIIP